MHGRFLKTYPTRNTINNDKIKLVVFQHWKARMSADENHDLLKTALMTH